MELIMQQEQTDYERVAEAIRYLETHVREQPDLKAVADHVGLSEYHFQRLFSRWAGISPKRFLQFLTVQHAKQLLAESNSVLDTTYETGLSSPGRLHDLFVTLEAMTPGEYKQQGAGLTIHYGFHTSPFGEFLLAITERGICNLLFVQDHQRQLALHDLAETWPQADLQENTAVSHPIATRIFQPSALKQQPPLKLLVKGTNFQVQVWQALLQVQAGTAVSYGTLAQLAGTPKAVRAVGTAVGHNPIAYLIPCHRVIRSVGGFGNYRWGATRKKAILGWEAARIISS